MNTAKVLEEIRNGAIIEVTDDGEVVAIMIPPGSSRLDVLCRAGEVTPARTTLAFADIPRTTSPLRTSDVLDDLREERSFEPTAAPDAAESE